MKISEFMSKYESFCPKELAVEGDPVGLQVGNPEQELTKVLVTLDIREQTVAEAKSLGVDLIIAKHPLIFRPLTALTSMDNQEKLVLDLAQAGIAVYTSHTNIDVVKGGLNDYFAQLLGLTDVEVLDDDEGLGALPIITPSQPVPRRDIPGCLHPRGRTGAERPPGCSGESWQRKPAAPFLLPKGKFCISVFP